MQSCNNLEEMYKYFTAVILKSINLFVPKTKAHKVSRLPKLLKSILKTKQELYNKSKEDPSYKKAYLEQSKLYKSISSQKIYIFMRTKSIIQQ